MKSETIVFRNRAQEKRALDGLRISLALVFLALGGAFLFVPMIGDDLARIGDGPAFRWVLGVAHIVGGLALLVPRLARRAATALGLFVTGSALYLYFEGARIVPVVPAFLVFVLLLFAAGLHHRRRADASVWSEMLGRYADQQDSLRSENV